LTLALSVASTTAVLILFGVNAAWGLWALAGTFLLWLGLEHVHGAAATRILRLFLTAARRLELRVLREKEGDFSGGHESGVYNVNTNPDSMPPLP
jgi:hypothetical protein